MVTDDGLPSGNPVIQTANDPAPGFYVSTTALEDPSRDRKDPRRYVNSEAVNYIVIPGHLNAKVDNQIAKLGDFAVVIRPEIKAPAYAVKALGIPSDLKNSDPKKPGIAEGILYIVFPGSAQGWPLSQQEIDRQGAALFSKWGGVDKAKKTFPQLTWR